MTIPEMHWSVISYYSFDSGAFANLPKYFKESDSITKWVDPNIYILLKLTSNTK